MVKEISAEPVYTTWELPSFNELIYCEKREKYALVIPVINEGERIRNQLKQIKAANFPIDVVIADGGSSDGSLDHKFIQTANVRTVLTKMGTGKLSAQLRMAYAWCIKQGYDGIVTMDGNGKDGVEAIALFLEKLAEGYDYVQGSRYQRNGEHQNTPLIRTFANRFVHAPMLSLAGKKLYTDTTNGYRAYSSRYLLDPRVQPFREIFSSYELLFYLTVRAGQLGLRIIEIPVTRRYPSGGKIPTKIKGIGGLLKVLCQTVDVATGGFAPDNSASCSKYWFVGIVFVSITLAIFFSNVISPPYSPDSWAYYELSKTVFGDFFRINQIRTYWDDSPYSSSFPPLYPFFIATFNSIFSVGARASYFLNFVYFIIFAILAEYMLCKYFDLKFVGLGLALWLVSNTLMTELLGGRSIPLQMIIYCLLILLLLRLEKYRFLSCLIVGAVAGLAILNRFDALFLPPLLAIACFLFWRRALPSFAILVGALVMVTPWIYYSLTHFGVLFVSDNSSVVISINPNAFVTDWWPDPQPNAFDDIFAWVNKINANMERLVNFAKRTFTETHMYSVFKIFFILLFGLIVMIRISRGHLPKGTSDVKKKLYVVTAFLIIMAIILLPQVLTGYYDARYYSALYFSLFVWLFAIVSLCLCSRSQRTLVGIVHFALCAVLGVVQAVGLYLNRPPNADRIWANFEHPPILEQLSSCMADQSSSRVLVLGSGVTPAFLGALGGFSALYEPRNARNGFVSQDWGKKFARTWDVKFVLVTNKARLDWARAQFNLSKVRNCQLPLYSVS